MTTITSQLMRHMEWADLVVYDSIEHFKLAGSDDNIRALLHHAHAVQWVYLCIWNGEPPDVPEADEFRDLKSVKDWGLAGHERLREFAAELTQSALSRTVVFPWRDMLEAHYGVARSATLEETIVQVATHSVYHRGQINRRLRELGTEPPLTDFIAWIWAGRPEPRREDLDSNG